MRLYERDDERQKEMGDVRATGLDSWTTVAPSAYMSKVGIPAWDRPATNNGVVSQRLRNPTHTAGLLTILHPRRPPGTGTARANRGDNGRGSADKVSLARG